MSETHTHIHSFGKEEHLYGKSAVGTLLEKGRWGVYGPLKYCVLIPGGSDGTNRVMVSVSKRLFKRAVKRNLFKRMLREAYRTQKHILDVPGVSCDLFLMYSTKELLSFGQVHSAVGGILTAVRAKMTAHTDAHREQDGLSVNTDSISGI